ncbi:SrfA family protein [Gilliamella apicola]|uniref:SrfA family protein n=1 Tax=Gilliamella apicola TaxID=1196095 RepID=UPI002FEDF9E6
MVNTLLRSGDIKDFKMLGHDGKAVYLVAAQIREMFRVKLGKQYADYLAIPQRNDQGNIVDWYIPFDSTQSDGQYDIIPWTSASESEQEEALILLKEFENKVMNLGKQLASNPNLAGDQLIFSRLIYDPKNNIDSSEPNLMAIRFPSNQFVYIVNGKPVITFWGFVYPQTPQNSSPFDCLQSIKQPIPLASTITEPEVIKKKWCKRRCKRWWKLWWAWLLGLLLLLLLLFPIFLLRGCGQNLGVSINHDIADENNINQLLPADEKQDVKEINNKDQVVDRQTNIINGTQNNSKDVVDANGVPINTEVQGDTLNTVDPNAIPNNVENNGDINQIPDALNSNDDKIVDPNLVEADKKDNLDGTKDEDNKGQIPEELNKDNNSDTNVNLDKVDNLTLSPDQIKQGSTEFLDGQWSVSGGIQDKATGKPLQLSYEFKDGNGQVTVTRSDGVKCVGQVDSGIQHANLNIGGNNQAICSDNNKYQLPKIQCKSGNNNQADCQGIYDNGASFPITMKKQ